MNNLDKIVEKLSINSKRLPIDKLELENTIEVLFHQILFPICAEDCDTRKDIQCVHKVLIQNISNLIKKEDALQIVGSFINELL